MEVCLQRISRDSVGVCLRWIQVDLVVVRLCSCVYKLDFFDLRFFSLATTVVLVCWSYVALYDDFPTVYYNKVCSAPMRRDEDDGAPSARFSAISRR